MSAIAPEPTGELSPYSLMETMDLPWASRDRYFELAQEFLPTFLKETKFSLVAAAQGRIERAGQSLLHIEHLWQIADANALFETMKWLGKEGRYGAIDDLVVREDQDLCVGFGNDHGFQALQAPSVPGWTYVYAHYHLETHDLSRWDCAFDEHVKRFAAGHPQFVHLGNRLRITGEIYKLFQLWMVPGMVKTADAQAIIASAGWSRQFPALSVEAYQPTPYDITSAIQAPDIIIPGPNATEVTR